MLSWRLPSTRPFLATARCIWDRFFLRWWALIAFPKTYDLELRGLASLVLAGYVIYWTLGGVVLQELGERSRAALLTRNHRDSPISTVAAATKSDSG